MQLKSLQMKRIMRTALLVLLLSVVWMGKGYAQQDFDFSAVCSTGQTLYYKINDASNHYVTITYPGNNPLDPWNGFAQPTGDIILPNSVTYNGINYAVTSINHHAFYNCNNLTGSLSIPNSVTIIGNFAFSGCSGFTGSLTISNFVTRICEGAFANCSGFTGDLLIPNSVTMIDMGAFYGCSGFMGDLIIGNSVTTIGNRAFFGCSGFSGSLTIGNSVTSIGCEVFNNCSNLSNVYYNATNCADINYSSYSPYDVYFPFSGCGGTLTIGDNVERIPKNMFRNGAFTGRLTIGNSVTIIDELAFYNCTGLTGELIIPNSVVRIEDAATIDTYPYTGGVFGNCTGLTSLVLGNSLMEISSQAFRGCSSLTSVTIPNSVTMIGGSAFSECSSLTSVTIPNSVTSIGQAAFWGCSSLTSVTIPNSVTTIDKYAFDRTGWYEQQPDGILYLDYWCLGYKGESPTGSLVLEGNTRGIANEAFRGCSGLIGSLTIPNSVTTMGESAFFGCSGFTGDLIIGNSVKTIGKEAFSGCSGFASASIPHSVTTIAENAFKDCESIKEISFNAKNCEEYKPSLFSDCTEVTTIIIGDSVEYIRANMFSSFDNLTTVTIGKSVKSIVSGAFANNPRLNMIYYNVEKNLDSDDYVFYNCPNLTTIHIGADVQEIGSNIFKGCNTVHFVVALGPTPAILDAGAFSDIVDNSVLMVSCGKRVTYYSVWNMFPFNNIIEDCDTYGINVGAVGNGGIITPSVSEAQMGQQVQITITPNPGMVLASIKVCNANDPTQIIPITPIGKSASNYSFVMPPFEVVVMATFKTSGTSVDENSSIEVSVYPNPTTGHVKIEAEDLKHISINNMLGRQIYNGKVNGDEFEYDFGKHGNGLYLIRIETANGVTVKKVSVR